MLHVAQIESKRAHVVRPPISGGAGTKRPGSILTGVHVEIWGLLDQGLASGVNFFTLVLVARALTPRDFGYFVLAFTMLQSAGRLQAALIAGAHNVLGVRRRGTDYVRYTSTILALEGVFTGGAVVVVLVATGIAAAFGFTQTVVFIAAMPALVSWQLQDLTRRILYTERRLRGAFTNDLVTYGGLACLLALLARADALSAERAMYALAAAFSVGALIGLWQLRTSYAATYDATSARETWTFGKWLGAAEASYWFSSQFYVYLAGAVLSSAASGVLKAGQTLLGPIVVFQTFYTNFLPVKFAHGDPRENLPLTRVMRTSYRVIVPITVAYCALVAAAAGPLLRLVYGTEFAGAVTVVRLFALYYVILALSLVITAALTARELTRDIFLANAGGGLLSVGFGWILLVEWGVAGAVVGMIVSWIVITALLARAHLVAPFERRLHEDVV
jgi:O-antigen/teichoic acid export membrane protein